MTPAGRFAPTGQTEVWRYRFQSEPNRHTTIGHTMISSALLSSAATSLATHGGWGWGGGGGPGWLFLLIPLFWIAVIVTLFAVFGRRWRRRAAAGGYYGGPGGWHNQAQADSRSAEKTLAERFAQGDIDEVEYRARLEVLRANRPDTQTPPN